jgi:2'-5' RNA ligase
MRLFLAIDIPDEIKENIRKLIENISKNDVNVRFTEPKNLHLTLKFLGEVDEKELTEVETKTLDVAAKFGPFDAEIGSMGYFGTPDYLRVLWIDITRGKDKIVEIMRELNKELNHIRREVREENPHLTIGRIKSGRNKDILLREVERNKSVKFGRFPVNVIKLKKSVLRSEGPEYSEVKKFYLKER